MSLKKTSLVFVLSIGAVAPPAVLAQDAAAGKVKSEPCAACHGADGNSVVGTFPILAGQNARASRANAGCRAGDDADLAVKLTHRFLPR